MTRKEFKTRWAPKGKEAQFVSDMNLLLQSEIEMYEKLKTEAESKERFILTSENLTSLGGPMGSEFTYPNWVKPFNTIEEAKVYAEKEYGKPIKWNTQSNGRISSPDLLYVMYYIERE